MTTLGEADGRFAVASYNIHRCIGTDGRHDPDRIAEVICNLRADIIGLQEVDARYHVEGGVDQIRYLAEATGYDYVEGPTLRRHGGRYGNGLLTRWPVLATRQLDISVSGREPRGAIDADIDVDHHPVRVIVTHLGLRLRERRLQVEQLLRALSTGADDCIALMGDFNEWMPNSRTLLRIHARFGRSRAFRTFPSWRPLLALDRIWVQPRHAVADAHVHLGPLTRVASDHLPLRASISRSGLRPEIPPDAA